MADNKNEYDNSEFFSPGDKGPAPNQLEDQDADGGKQDGSCRDTGLFAEEAKHRAHDHTSDMALISSDVGVDSPDVCFIQILRMIIVVVFFP